MYRPRKHIAIFPSGLGVDFLRAECGHDSIWMKGSIPAWLPTLMPSVYGAIGAADFTFSSFRPLPLTDPDFMPLPSGQGWTTRVIAPIGGAYPDLWGGVIFVSGHQPSVCLDKFVPGDGGIRRVLENFFSKERIDSYRRGGKAHEEIWVRAGLQISDMLDEPYHIPAWLKAVQGLEPAEAAAKMVAFRSPTSDAEALRIKAADKQRRDAVANDETPDTEPAPEPPATPQPEKTQRERVQAARKTRAKLSRAVKSKVRADKFNAESAKAFAEKQVRKLERSEKP
jgi:hypothetical protein